MSRCVALCTQRSLARAMGVRCVLMSFGVMLCAVVAACSIDRTLGFEATSAHPTDVQTVAVTLFENQTFSRGTETLLADAIGKEMKLRTPWQLAPVETADTVLEGVIVRETLVPLTTGRQTGLSQEMAVRLTVRFVWRDQRSGQARLSRGAFSAAETFVPSQRVRERIDVGRLGAVQELATAIVGELRSDW